MMFLRVPFFGGAVLESRGGSVVDVEGVENLMMVLMVQRNFSLRLLKALCFVFCEEVTCTRSFEIILVQCFLGQCYRR